VQVAGDPLAVAEHLQLLALLLGPGPLQGEGGLPGEILALRITGTSGRRLVGQQHLSQPAA